MATTPSTRPITGHGTHPGAFRAGDWGLLSITSLIWGASFLFIAVGLRSLEPGVIAAARVLLGASALLLFKRSRAPIERSDWWRIAAIGVVGQGAPALLFALAEQHIDSALAGMLVSTVPIATVILVVAFTRKLPGVYQLGGIALGFVGVFFLAQPALGGVGASTLGVVYVLIAVFGYALSNVLYPPLQHRYGSLPVIMWSQVVATVALAPLGIAGLSTSRWEWAPVAAVFVLGVFGTGIARAVHITLVGRVGPARGTLTSYFIPIIALTLGVVFLDEVVEPIQLIGIAVALSGSYLVSRRERPG
ncbi:MAG: DMT family transporter [Acidimicrobiia bacterium]|nr:DMT family transporter [Acidimicrobiia bacterium]NNL99061.1 DMT family transporter [Acidimicrobiia bacterium]